MSKKPTTNAKDLALNKTQKKISEITCQDKGKRIKHNKKKQQK